MKTWPLHFTIKEGEIINPSFTQALSRLIAYAKKNGKGDYTLTIERKNKKRTNPQNAYYWGVVVPIIRDLLVSFGNEWIDNDYSHEYLKEMFLEKSMIFLPINGELDKAAEISLSTTKLTTEEFSQYIEKIKHWSAEEFGIDIPDPETAKSNLLF